tara:strand:+ start:123910 stop:124107 length:198 start_codon:yes stop_codon:yes gene_type:complete
MRRVKHVELEGFTKEAYTMCKMHVTFEDGLSCTLHGQVSQNPIRGYFTVNGIDANGNQAAVKIID